MRHVLAALITVYRWAVSPFLGRNCRFSPSCSQYAREAVLKHGTIRGVFLAGTRIARCHPWHPGGVDPVP